MLFALWFKSAGRSSGFLKLAIVVSVVGSYHSDWHNDDTVRVELSLELGFLFELGIVKAKKSGNKEHEMPVLT
jgi:hypothetical protein